MSLLLKLKKKKKNGYTIIDGITAEEAEISIEKNDFSYSKEIKCKSIQKILSDKHLILD